MDFSVRGKMEKDSFELRTGLAAETRHCDNASQTPTEITSPPLQALDGGYDASRLNALRHGVLSAHTVLSWEDKAEYEALLSALAQEHAPHGPTEEHLVEEIAGIIWRNADCCSQRERHTGEVYKESLILHQTQSKGPCSRSTRSSMPSQRGPGRQRKIFLS